MDAELVELVERARRRDAQAFGALAGRFERTALSVAYAQVGDSNRAADVAQEAFLRAWQKLGALTDSARFGAWFCGIVRNIAIDHRRRLRAVDASLPIDGIQNSRDPSLEIDRTETQGQINAALESLDEVSRTAVVLRYYENLSSREIGQLLDLSAAAVDMRLCRARQELKQRLAGVIEMHNAGPVR